MSYQHALPEVFPYCAVVEPAMAGYLATALLTHGASFACTTDTPGLGQVRFWVSQSSYEYLQARHPQNITWKGTGRE